MIHGIPKCIYMDRRPQFLVRFWREILGLMGTTLRYSIVYHLQTQGIVERMNSVIGQMLRCTLHDMNDIKNRLDILPTI